jgi:DNA gyrase subunit A
VHGIRLHDGDQVVAMGLARPDHDLLVITERGIGKRTPITSYPLQGRYGQGVYTIKNVDKIGNIVAAAVVALDMEMVLMSAAGQVIRQPVNMVRQTGRNAQGVHLMGLNEGDSVVSMACLTVQPDSDGTIDGAADDMNGEVTEMPILDAPEPYEADIEEEVGEALEDNAE